MAAHVPADDVVHGLPVMVASPLVVNATEAAHGDAAPPAVAPKAVTGETWGAAGPIGIVTALEAMRMGRVPGRPRTFVPDPALSGLNLPRESYDGAVRHALVLDVSWGGQLTAVVLSAWSGHGR